MYVAIVCLLSLLAVYDAADPEQDMSLEQVIDFYGYRCEVHNVTTSDGYVLGLFRIPGPKNETSTNSAKPIFFLQHGLEGSARNFVLDRENKSAAITFASRGFDVWLGNYRGNAHSRRHVSLDPDQKPFWQFSYDEHGRLDLPAMIDYALNLTGQDGVYYMGHSMGTTGMFVALAAYPQFNRKVKEFFALGPVVSLGYTTKPLRAALEIYRLDPAIVFLASVHDEILLSSNNSKLPSLAIRLCNNPVLVQTLCRGALASSGPFHLYTNVSRAAVYGTGMPSGSSIHNARHYADSFVYNQFQTLDWGAEENLKRYGKTTPIVYNLTAITTPVHLYYSSGDWGADVDDVERYLKPRLSSLVTSVDLLYYNHLEFLFSTKIYRDILQPILKYIQEKHGLELGA